MATWALKRKAFWKQNHLSECLLLLTFLLAPKGLQLGITPASPHALKVLCAQSQSEGYWHQRKPGEDMEKATLGALKAEPQFPSSSLIPCPMAPSPFSRVLTQIHKWKQACVVYFQVWMAWFPLGSMFLGIIWTGNQSACIHYWFIF